MLFLYYSNCDGFSYKHGQTTHRLASCKIYITSFEMEGVVFSNCADPTRKEVEISGLCIIVMRGRQISNYKYQNCIK